MARLVTGGTKDYSLKDPRKNILDKIEDNRTIDGDVLCISCNSSNFKKEVRDITVSDGFTDKKVVKLDTYYCDLCDYVVIDDKETKFLRKKVK